MMGWTDCRSSLSEWTNKLHIGLLLNLTYPSPSLATMRLWESITHTFLLHCSHLQGGRVPSAQKNIIQCFSFLPLFLLWEERAPRYFSSGSGWMEEEGQFNGLHSYFPFPPVSTSLSQKALSSLFVHTHMLGINKQGNITYPLQVHSFGLRFSWTLVVILIKCLGPSKR